MQDFAIAAAGDESSASDTEDNSAMEQEEEGEGELHKIGKECGRGGKGGQSRENVYLHIRKISRYLVTVIPVIICRFALVLRIHIILIRIQIQDLNKLNPDPRKHDTDPDPG